MLKLDKESDSHLAEVLLHFENLSASLRTLYNSFGSHYRLKTTTLETSSDELVELERTRRGIFECALSVRNTREGLEMMFGTHDEIKERQTNEQNRKEVSEGRRR